MIDLILLSLLVLSSTALWPLNRWAMSRGARTEPIGIVISLVAAPGAMALSLALQKPFLVSAALGLGALAGVAYAVGFILIIFYCLNIGPSGPTVTINNMGLLWPVAISIVFYSGGKDIPPLTWAGMAAAVGALLLMGWSHAEDSGARPMTRHWAKWAIIGWVFSGISMGSQFLSSHYAPEAPFGYTASMFAVSWVILAIVMRVKRGGRLRREELIAGGVTGLMMTGMLPLTIVLLTRMSAAVVYPVTVAGPAVLMLLVGHLVFKERLSALGWVASVLGVIGIVLLSVR
jgi:drug/metabolite transporter (DMT)-like permease